MTAPNKYVVTANFLGLLTRGDIVTKDQLNAPPQDLIANGSIRPATDEESKMEGTWEIAHPAQGRVEGFDCLLRVAGRCRHHERRSLDTGEHPPRFQMKYIEAAFRGWTACPFQLWAFWGKHAFSVSCFAHQ